MNDTQPVEQIFPKWWEKTVEYAFVRRFSCNAFQISPMAGKVEKFFGDALLKSWEGFRLIEFKRDISSIPIEHRKYGTREEYHTALKTLRDLAGSKAHWLVYAEEQNTNLVLHKKSYCDIDDVSGSVLTSAAELTPCTAAQFYEYAAKLGQLRGSDETETGSSGIALLAVDTSGATVVVDLAEVMRLIEKELGLKPKKVRRLTL